MSILTQNLPASYPHFFDSDLLSQLISPFASSYSVIDYGLLISQLSSSFHHLIPHLYPLHHGRRKMDLSPKPFRGSI